MFTNWLGKIWYTKTKSTIKFKSHKNTDLISERSDFANFPVWKHCSFISNTRERSVIVHACRTIRPLGTHKYLMTIERSRDCVISFSLSDLNLVLCWFVFTWYRFFMVFVKFLLRFCFVYFWICFLRVYVFVILQNDFRLFFYLFLIYWLLFFVSSCKIVI